MPMLREMRGVCLIAYGGKAEHEAQECLKSLAHYHTWAHCVAGSKTGPGQVMIEQEAGYSDVQRARWAKVMLDQWSPFTETLYLDADTRVQGDLDQGFKMLEDGWEMLITHSERQDQDSLWHVLPDERAATFENYQCSDVLQLQGGVFWFRQCEAVRRFFEAWREAWLEYRQFDQAALLRALRVAPVRLHVLGRPFNGGALIAHRHGQAAK